MHENNYIVAFPHFLFISIFLFSRLFHFVAVERDKNSVLNSNRLIIISCPSHLVCKSIATVCPCPFPPFHSIDCNYRSIIMVLSLTMMLVLFVRLLLLWLVALLLSLHVHVIVAVAVVLHFHIDQFVVFVIANLAAVVVMARTGWFTAALPITVLLHALMLCATILEPDLYLQTQSKQEIAFEFDWNNLFCARSIVMVSAYYHKFSGGNSMNAQYRQTLHYIIKYI